MTPNPESESSPKTPPPNPRPENAATVPPDTATQPAAQPTFSLQPGARPVPEYELVRPLGRGGFGEVWQAVGPGGFAVVLKFIPTAGKVGQTEMRALELMKHLRHPHLLTMFGAWQRDGFLIIAMELGERTLQQRWQEAADQGQPGIPQGELLEYMREAAKGIDYLNEARHPGPEGRPVGVQHRDIKPQNLLLLGGCVKVADFGLAKLLEQTAASASGAMTPVFAAPEFFENKATRWSDQYSLAVTYCQLRGGRLPFSGSPADVMMGHLMNPPDLTMLPPAERDVVRRALAKKPDERWPDCRTFVEALAGPGKASAFTGTTVIHRPESEAGRARRRRWLVKRIIWGAILATLVLMAPSIALLLFQSGSSPATKKALREEKGNDPGPAGDAVSMIRRLGGSTGNADPERGQPITRVSLRKSDVRDSDLALLSYLPDLRTLDLGETSITNRGLGSLELLKELKELYLDGCQNIDDDGISPLVWLPLRKLVLSRTGIGDDGIAQLPQGRNPPGTSWFLEELDLSSTRISDSVFYSLGHLPRLKQLNISACKRISGKVTSGVGRGLADLRDGPLRKLDLSRSPRIDDASLAGLKDWKWLEDLDLSETDVGDAGLEHLSGLTTLRKLNLRKTRVSESGVKKLQTALPKLEIQR
jgi:serine/threonine protein kinase